MDKLYIVDGNSLAFRAFYGLPPLHNSAGIPCNAVFGFMKMLINIITKNSPKYLAVAFDAGKHNFRHEIYSEYKGTRKPTPEDLRSQLPIIKDILKQMNITTIEIPEIEADDIIGCLSKRFDIECVLVSGDRDLLQLISPKCRVWLTQKGLTEVADLGVEELKAKYGITPAQVIEIKSIMGDTSDNIPGVKGVGEKTALGLLEKYNDLDGIYSNLDSLTPRLKGLLEENKDKAYMSKQLATIKTDFEIDLNLNDLTYEFPFSQQVRKSFIWLEFNNIVKNENYFSKEKIVGAVNNWEKVVLQTMEEKEEYLKSVLNLKQVSFMFDEAGFSFGEQDKEFQFLNFDLTDDKILSAFKNIMESNSVEKIVCDAKALMRCFDLYGIELNNFYDVAIAYYLLGVAERELNIKSLIEKQGLDDNCMAVGVYNLKSSSLEQLKKSGMVDLYYNLELKLVRVLFNMEQAGITVDEIAIKQLSEKYGDEIALLTNEIYSLAGQEFNINSPKQMQEILFDKLKLEYKGKKGTSVEVLEAIENQHPIITKILRYRKVSKIYSTYLEGLGSYIKDGKIHTTFIQTATATGRLSSREPNLQNIPVRDDEGRELRKLFASSFENGVIVSADYSQIELRLLAHFSKDKILIDCFNNGQDIHTATASRIFNVPINEVTSQQRGLAKSVNFGIIYGISDYGLSQNVHISKKDAKQFIEKYFELYPTIKLYMNNNVQFARENGFATTLLGRIRNIPEINSSNYTVRGFGERVAMNMPLQGSASDIIKMAMVNVQNRMERENLKSKLILQIHDELIVDAVAEEKEVVEKILKEEMENVVKLEVPLVVGVGSGASWFDAK